MDMIENIEIYEPLRLGQGKIIYQGNDGIIMHELRSDALMISMNDVHHFIDIYEKENLQRLTLIDVKQENIKDILCQKYQHPFQFACYQAVYTKKEKVDIICPKNVTIQLLDQSYLSLVCDKYHYVNSCDLQKKMEKGHLWGLFEDHQIAGFIGIHDEGSMGLYRNITSIS